MAGWEPKKELTFEEKVGEVITFHEAMHRQTGRNPVLGDWFVKILDEVAEVPRYRTMVHDIRSTIAARQPKAPIARGVR